jgi:ABC-type microcin C transport system permease subunit YejE
MEPAAPQRFSRPVYEGLPWFYVICGIAALVGSYLLPSGVLSVVAGVVGLVGVVGGVVIVLRRRDYRALRSEYVDPDALNVASPPQKDQE